MSDQEKGLALIAGVVVLALIGTIVKGLQPVSLADRSAPKASTAASEAPKVCGSPEGRIHEMGTLYSDSACTQVFGIITEIKQGKIIVSVVDRSTMKADLQILDRDYVKKNLYSKD